MKWLDVNPDFGTKATINKKSSKKSKGKGLSAFSFKPLKTIKKQGLKSAKKQSKTVEVSQDREGFASGRTVHGKPKWRALRRGLIDARVKGHAFIKTKVLVPKGHEVVSDDLGPEGEQIFGKVQKAPEGVGGALEEYEATVTKKVNTDPYWRDEYTNAVIRNDSNIEIDHVVPVKRARESGKFRTKKDQQKFYEHINNLAITERKTNQSKGSLFLGQMSNIVHGRQLRNPATNPDAQLSPKNYAKKYGEVMKHFGMIMTHGEAREYKRLTGQEFSGGKQHIAQDVHGQSIADSQQQYDFMLARKKK